MQEDGLQISGKNGFEMLRRLECKEFRLAARYHLSAI